MSGSPTPLVLLEDDANGRITAYVRTLKRLPSDLKWILVGGLAVNVRLGRVHRATNDIDTMSTHQDLLVQLLVSFPGSESLSTAKVQLHDPEVEVDVMDSTENSELPLHERERAFALARRFAMSTASPVTIGAVGADGKVIEQVTVNVAAIAALVALKTLAFPDRRNGSYPAKIGSDMQDLLRLVEAHTVGNLATEFGYADTELVSFVSKELIKNFAGGSVDLRYNYVRIRRNANNVDAQAITEDRLIILGDLGISL